MAKYITKAFDMLDDIVFDRYGDTENDIVIKVLDANPGLERQPLVLPAGLTIELPDRAKPTKAIPVVRQIRLWE